MAISPEEQYFIEQEAAQADLFDDRMNTWHTDHGLLDRAIELYNDHGAQVAYRYLAENGIECNLSQLQNLDLDKAMIDFERSKPSVDPAPLTKEEQEMMDQLNEMFGGDNDDDDDNEFRDLDDLFGDK